MVVNLLTKSYKNQQSVNIHVCIIREDRKTQEFLKRRDVPLNVFFRGILLSECIISTIFLGGRGGGIRKKKGGLGQVRGGGRFSQPLPPLTQHSLFI
jgi:hypothetical protein